MNTRHKVQFNLFTRTRTVTESRYALLDVSRDIRGQFEFEIFHMMLTDCR